MKLDMIVQVLKPNTIITKSEFEVLVLEFEPKCSERAIYWKLKRLCDLGILLKRTQNIFYVVGEEKEKRKYNYYHSDRVYEIIEKIEKEYPLVDFQVWETIQFNEFVNHQIAQNTIFIEVEHMLEESIFNMLLKDYERVLYCPKPDTFFLYFENQTIVIQRLTTEAPKPLEATKTCCLEKLLVDLFSNKILNRIIEGAELPYVYMDAFEKYNIDEKKLFRYARRRNKEKVIRNFIAEKTDIKLITEGKNVRQEKLRTGVY